MLSRPSLSRITPRAAGNVCPLKGRLRGSILLYWRRIVGLRYSVASGDVFVRHRIVTGYSSLRLWLDELDQGYCYSSYALFQIYCIT